MSDPLYLVHIPVRLSKLRRFSEGRGGWDAMARSRREDGHEADAGFDEGRALHHVLSETFGPKALHPFRLMAAPGKTRGSLYAYTRTPKQNLLAAARETGPPEAASILDMDDLASKEMPSHWMAERRLGFDIRVRPVMRLMAALPNGRDPKHPYKKGQEIDAYFVEGARRFPDAPRRILDGKTVPSGMMEAGRTREAVYRDWLAARMGSAIALAAEQTKLAHFRRTRAARRDHAPEGPDAVLHGELVVKDPIAFAALLEKGVGRHKAYGYGMLLLRPAGRAET